MYTLKYGELEQSRKQDILAPANDDNNNDSNNSADVNENDTKPILQQAQHIHHKNDQKRYSNHRARSTPPRDEE